MPQSKSWYMEYQPRSFNELVLPAHEPEVCANLAEFYANGAIKGNFLAYGEPGLGKTSAIDVFIDHIVHHQRDLFILDRTTNDIDKLKSWLQYSSVGKQKIVKIEEMDKLSPQAQTLLKDGLMEKYQHNCTFLATTNNLDKIDPAILQRFNIKLEFKNLPEEDILERIRYILIKEEVNFKEEDLKYFVNDHAKKSLREIINEAENITLHNEFKPFANKPHTKIPNIAQTTPEITIDHFIFQGELQRLKETYGRSLNREQMASELHIETTSMETRLRDNIDLPPYYKPTKGRKILFPVTAVARFLTTDLIYPER